MKKLIIIGMVLMLVLVGMLSGCVKTYNAQTKIIESKIVRIDECWWIPDTVYFDNGMELEVGDDNIRHIEKNRVVKIVFNRDSPYSDWIVESYEYLE